MDDLDLGAIRAFVAVLDNGDFTAAGRKLRISRSAVGKAVARLEGRLGVRLLNRSTRRVSATTDGQMFYDRCVQILADLAEAEASLRPDRQNPGGLLKLSLPDAYGRSRILPILQDYLARWPAIDAEVTFTDRITDIMAEGYDMAIRIGGGAASAGLIARVVDRIEGGFCAAPAYLDARGRPERPEDLRGHDRLIFGRPDRPMPWPLPDDGRRPAGRTRLTLDSADALRSAALAGLGIAHLPWLLVADDLDAGRLVPVLPEIRIDPLPVHILYPARRHLPARVRLLIDMIGERLG